MPYSDPPWDDESTPFGHAPPPEDEHDDFWGGDDPDLLSVWKPRDPDPWFSPTLPERNAYRAEMGRMAGLLSTENLGWETDENGKVIQKGFAEAFGSSGFGADYAPPGLGWTPWDGYQPRSRVGLSSWGWNYKGLVQDPFPILSGAVISPVIDITSRKREPEYDEHGRELYNPSQLVRSQLLSGRTVVGQIMQRAASKGQAELARLKEAGMPMADAGPLAERVARQSVRTQVQPFGRADFGERWNTPFALRAAIAGSAQIRFHGDYSLGPKALFGELGQIGRGYFTKATSPSVELEHPERGSWASYSMDSLYALGWLPTPDGGFITGSNKPAKRRQLGVQKLAAPIGADHLLRRGRLTGDVMLNTTAVFLDNYPFSEGSGVVDPTLVAGFRDYRPLTIERPMRAGEDWQINFKPDSSTSQVAQMFGRRWKTVGDHHMHDPGESVFVGEQRIGGKWEPLEELKGIEGVSQGIFGYRKTKSGYQVLVERQFPFESGTAKLMHHGMKALLFQSSEIIEQMQGRVRSAIGAGLLPGDVEDPRMVLPMPKDWMQTYRGMFDFLPEETLRGMGLSDEIIAARKWSKAAPEVIDRLKAYADERRFTFQQQHEVPVTRLGAFTKAKNARDISYFEKGGEQWARFTATHTGYALPIAAGIRMEYPGKKPMYSPEELMQLARRFPIVAKGLLGRGNAASRIWGVAAAAAEGIVPEGAIQHEMLPWLTARLGVEGSFDDEGTARTLISNLARDLKEMGHGRSAIVAPGGVLLPAPADVLSKSVKGLSGQEQSTFVSPYIQALSLMGRGEDPTEALATFSQALQTFAAGHNVRREAMGARLKNAAEGTFTSHMAIPDDVVVAGRNTLLRLAGIRPDDPDMDDKLRLFMDELESGKNPFYVLGTRRPISDMDNQLGVPLRVITEHMARSMYDVPIENLGRSYAVSPTVAAIWRGDVDADRALLHAVTRVRYNDQVRRVLKDPANVLTGETGAIPAQLRRAFGNTGYDVPGLVKMRALPSEEVWREAGATFITPRDVLREVSGMSLMERQIAAIRTHAPAAYDDYVRQLTPDALARFQAGDTLALSEALHGIDVDWNESRKWSDDLKINPGKNLPQTYAWYADATKDKKDKTVFTREEMLADFERTAKSKMLMGRGYNRYLRGLTSLAQSPEELQAAITFASNVYQKALDNQEMSAGELMLFNMMESIGPSGAMFDKFITETNSVRAAVSGGEAGLVSMLASSVVDIDAPADARALLFSRDPAIQRAVRSGSAWNVLRTVGLNKGDLAGAQQLLEDPTQAGILTQLVQAMHWSKGSMADVEKTPAQQAYAVQGQRIRAMTRVLGRAEEGGLPLAPYSKKNTQGKEVAMPGAIEDVRNMAGLSTRNQWQRAMAARMGLPEMFFASEEDVLGSLPNFKNPALPGKEFPAYISEREAAVLEGLRQMPVGQAQQIAAAVSRPPQYTPKGGTPSFDTTVGNWWDKFTPEQQQEIVRMRRHGQPEEAIEARRQQFLDQMQQQAAPGTGSEAVPPASGASIPVMITRDTRQQLYDLGLSRAEVDAMTPQEAHARLSQSVTSVPPAAVGDADPYAGDDPFGPLPPWLANTTPAPPPPQPEAQPATPVGAASPINPPFGAIPAGTPNIYGFEPRFPLPMAILRQPSRMAEYGVALEQLMGKQEMDISRMPPNLIGALMQSAPSGKSTELYVRGYAGGNYTMRMKLADLGLTGVGLSYLKDNLPGILQDPYSRESQETIAEGYATPGIGKQHVQNIRTFTGLDLRAAVAKRDANAVWRGIEASQRLREAMGPAWDNAETIAKNPELAALQARESDIFQAYENVQGIMEEDRQFALGGLASARARLDFDYERVWQRDPVLAKAMRTFGQRPDDTDVSRMTPEERRKVINQQRDAMASIRDRMGLLGITDLEHEFDAIQNQWITMGESNFESRSPSQRNAIQAALSYTTVMGLQGPASVMAPRMVQQLVSGEINATQLRALVNLPEVSQQLASLPATPATMQTRMKLLNEQRGDLMTLIGMNEKGEAPKELVDALAKNVETTRSLEEEMQKTREVQQQRVEQVRQQIEADPRYQQAQAALAQAQGQPQGTVLDPEQVKRFQALGKLRQAAGLETDDIEEVLGKSSMEQLLEGIGDAQAGGGAAQQRGGIRGAISRLFERAPGDPQSGTGALENMFTELTLGWTAFRARMAWGLATGAQRGWMNDFMGEESAAVGAALAGGVTPGSAGMASNYLSAQAAMANARAQMGEGVAQVYAPLMASASQLGTTPGMGAALTMIGTPLGAASVAALGAKMVGSAFPAIGAMAGPIGWGVLGATGLALGSSYLAGEAPEWVRYDAGTRAYNWRRAARAGELAGERPGGAPAWAGRLVGLAASSIMGYDESSIYSPQLLAQLDAEKAAWAPGSLAYDADKLRDWISDTYENRVPVDSALQLMGSLFQITGRTAEDVYEGRAPEFKALMDRYVQYMEGGASPNELFSSQVSALNAAGVPLGPQGEAWMVQFANFVPGQQRQMYEQAFQNLSPLASATMRPTTFDQATRAVALAESTGSMQRAASMVMGQEGIGWFTSTFGLEQEGAEAKSIGGMLTALPIAQQETIQRYGGTVAQSASRMGMTAREAAALSMQLGMTHPDDVMRVSNLTVQAESVALEAGEGMGGFQGLLFRALATGMQDRPASMQRWFMDTQTGGAGIAPQAMMPHGQAARAFEGTFSMLPESVQEEARVAATILNQVYPNTGYTPQQLSTLVDQLAGDVSIPELTLRERAQAGSTGIAAAMGVPARSPGASLIDRIIAGGNTPFTQAMGIDVGTQMNLTPDQAAALPGFLNSSMFQYMTSSQMAGISPAIGQMFGEFWNGEMSLYQFNRAMEVATGSTPWGYSAGLGFGPGSLVDEYGRQYGMYRDWTATAGRQAGASFAPLVDMQMGASYASLGYASASNAAQNRQFYRQLEMSRLNWGSGPFQPLGDVQAALFPTDGGAVAEPGSGMQVGGSTIGYAQQESAIRRQMWQESIAAQQQSIQFSRQGLEISRQGLEISRQELALSRQQYAIQREYKLQEQQAQRGMQLRQYEWAAEDYAIKVERTGISQQWQMEDLQRARRYAFGRQRVEIERQIERAQVTQRWERDDTNRARDRELEVQRYQDERYEAAVAFEQKLHQIQMERFGLQEQRLELQSQQLALQEAQLAAQEARLNTNTVLQEKLNTLEDERFKKQYEQAQAQMVEDEQLEKLRVAARNAELAYQSAQLANAETLRVAEEKFAESIQGIEEGGVLDRWIDFFNAIRGGPPGDTVPPVPPVESENGLPDSGRSMALPVAYQPSEAGISRDLAAANAAPTVVNFVLDGEVIMSAVVKPERLRPVVQEIQRRDSWR